MRWLWPTALLALSACSVMFDPGQVPPAGCPASPASCPELANATAACADAVCVYSCNGDFVDQNGDLAQASSDGCELDCGAGPTPVNPARLVATVGAAAGEVAWTFPEATPSPTKYELCTAPPGGAETCVNLDPAGACASGTCAQTTTGHADNVRVTGRVVSVDTCGRQGAMASAPTVSATPLDTSDPLKWTFDPSCGASTYEVTGGRLAIEQPGATCTSTLTAGDELWGDFTIEGDLDHTLTAQNMSGGFAVHVNGTGYRFAANVFPESYNSPDVSFLSRRFPAQNDVVTASSVHGADSTGHTHLKLVSNKGVMSFSIGADASSLREIMRWPDPQRHTGKVGMGAIGTGRIELGNLRVSTASDLPTGSPTSLKLEFSGASLPADTRPRGAMAGLTQLPCPALPQAASCDGGCAPPPDAGCLHITRTGLIYGSLWFDLPPGIDVSQPWRMSMRFAPKADAGVLNSAVLLSRDRVVLGAQGTAWSTGTAGFDEKYDASVSLDEWHRAEWRFDLDAGHYALTLDDVEVPLGDGGVYPAPTWGGPNLGALNLGGWFGNAWVGDVEISQP